MQGVLIGAKLSIQRGLPRHNTRCFKRCVMCNKHICLAMRLIIEWSLATHWYLGLFCSNIPTSRNENWFVCLSTESFRWSLHNRNLQRPACYALSDYPTPGMILRKLMGPIKGTKCKQQQTLIRNISDIFIWSWPGLNVKFVSPAS